MMAKRIRVVKNDMREIPVLIEGDVIEYKVTYHVEVEPGIEAWVGYGVISQVREGESGRDADLRVKRHVERTVDKRAREAAERA